MYELFFSIVVLLNNGKLGINQTSLHSFDNLEQCLMTSQILQKEMLKTAKESGTLPGILECRKVV